MLQARAEKARFFCRAKAMSQNVTLRNVRVKKASFLYRTQAMSQNVTNYYSCHSCYSCSSKNEYLVVANSRLQPTLYSLIACRDIGQRSQWQITCYGADVGFCSLGQACVWGNVLKYKQLVGVTIGMGARLLADIGV